MYLSIFNAIEPNIIIPTTDPNTSPENMLSLFLSLIALILAPVPKILFIAIITNCIGYMSENILIRFLSTKIPSKNHPRIGVTDVNKVSKLILNNLFISHSLFLFNYFFFI